MYALTVTTPCTNHPFTVLFKHPIQPLLAYKYLRVNAIHIFNDLVEYNGFDDFTEESFDVNIGYEWKVTVDGMSIRMSGAYTDDDNLFRSIDMYDDVKREQSQID